MTPEEEKYFRAAEDATSGLPYQHSISTDVQIVPVGAWVTVNILVPCSIKIQMPKTASPPEPPANRRVMKGV